MVLLRERTVTLPGRTGSCLLADPGLVPIRQRSWTSVKPSHCPEIDTELIDELGVRLQTTA